MKSESAVVALYEEAIRVGSPATGSLLRRPLLWLGLACLDAPLVAVTWQAILADAFGAQITIVQRTALFLTAWFIYLVDRIADSFTIPDPGPVSIRQAFYRRHRGPMILFAPVLATADTITALSLDRHTFFIGGIIAAAIVVYLAINHLADWFWRKLPVKEIMIGFLFAVGAAAAIDGAGLRFVWAVALFATLCALNCLSISAWEFDLDRTQKRSSFAIARPDLMRWPRRFCWALTLLAIASVGSLGSVAVCVAASAALLGFLHFPSLSRDERVALADLVLLTPLLVILLRR